jgi:putative DNA primase/helicase
MRFDETSYWLPDHRNSVFHTAANFLTECAHSPDWIGVRKGHGQTGFTQGVIDAAKSNPLMAKYSIDYNQDNMIAGFPGGYIDLRTCEIHKPDPALMIRNGLDVAPSASGKKPMRWLKFMEEITCGDVDLANWLQKFCGYCLTGMVDEQVIVYFFGNGRNGKSVFTTILTQILGNFAFAAPIEMLDRNVSLNREAQLARMEGVRLAFFNEPGENVKWKESLVKSMTGQDGKVSARALYGQPIDYVATYKVLVVGNYKPFLSGAEESMIGRFRLVPFKFTAKNPDLNLRANLAAEIPEILNWMIEGCKKWQSEGLGTCDAIKNASAEFFTDQDRIGTWLTERCVIDPKAECRSGDVMDLFNAFLAQDHDPLVNAREIKNLLQKKGFEYAKDKRGRLYRGFRLKTNKELEDEGNKPKPEFSVDNNVVDFDQFRAA